FAVVDCGCTVRAEPLGPSNGTGVPYMLTGGLEDGSGCAKRGVPARNGPLVGSICMAGDDVKLRLSVAGGGAKGRGRARPAKNSNKPLSVRLSANRCCWRFGCVACGRRSLERD